MSAISSHTFSQAFRKFVDDFRDHFHRNLGPCLFQASLQRFDQDVRLRACLGLQDAQNEEVHNIELRRVQCHSSRAEIERKTRKETNADFLPIVFLLDIELLLIAERRSCDGDRQRSVRAISCIERLSWSSFRRLGSALRLLFKILGQYP